MRNKKSALTLLLMQLFAMPLVAASIQGSVIDAVTNAPVPRAHVTLQGGTTGKQARYGATSAAGGSFSFTGIPAGDYEGLADRPGYIDQNGTGEGRVKVHVEADDSATGLTIKLTPTGSLTGRVTGSDGEPVEGANVSATGSRESGSAPTDETGRFRIGGLPPGKFRVEASHNDYFSPDKPEIRTDGTVEVHDAKTWWPSALAAAQAGRVEVKGGAETAGVDIKLVQVPFVRVSGRVMGAPQNTRASGQTLMIEQGNFGFGVPLRADGKFELWRLDPGSYTLSASWQAPNGEHVETVPVPVEVGSSNVDDIGLRVVPPSNISGHLEFEDDDAKKLPAQEGSPQQDQDTHIELASLAGSGVDSAIGSDGSFQLKNVAAGRYHVNLRWGTTYIKSMRLGSTAFDGPNLDLSNGAGGAELTVRVAAARGSISGTVQGSSEQRAGLVVMLVQQFGDDTDVLSSPVKPDGSWSFDKLPPARYEIRAVPEKDVEYLAGQMDDDETETVDLGADEKVTKDLKAPVLP
jgi:protocatechuate 3,4-dioxygenase beta subunit